jgi:hypothetical protein
MSDIAFLSFCFALAAYNHNAEIDQKNLQYDVSKENRQLLKLQNCKFKNKFMNRTDYILVFAFAILSNRMVQNSKKGKGEAKPMFMKRALDKRFHKYPALILRCLPCLWNPRAEVQNRKGWKWA